MPWEHAYKPASTKDFVFGIIMLFIAIGLVIIFGVVEYGFLFLSTHAWLGLGMILLGLLGGVEIGRCIEVYSRRAYSTPPTD